MSWVEVRSRRSRTQATQAGRGASARSAVGAEPWRRQALKAQAEPVDPVVAEVRAKKLTYLPVVALNDLFEAAVRADAEQRAGCFLEAGSALGGSAIVLARAKEPGRRLYVHDLFGMIPPPTKQDGEEAHRRYRRIKSGESKGIGGDDYYGYEADLLGKVRASFAEFGVPVDDERVNLVKGLFQDTITGDEPVALAHIDGDWYESVRTCLDRIGPRLSPGGVMVIDDYYWYSGCRTAVDEFLAAHPDEYRTVKRFRLHIERA